MVDLCFDYFLLKTKSQCIASARRSFDQEKKKIKKRHLKRMKRCLAVPGRTRNDCYWLRKLTRSGHRVNRKNLKNTIEDCDSPTASPTDATSDSPTGSPTMPSDVPSSLPSDASAPPTDAPSDSPTLSPSSEMCFNDADIVTAVTWYFDDKEVAEIEYGGIGSWATCGVTDFENLFAYGTLGYGYYDDDGYTSETFNQNLNDWDLSLVTSLQSTFQSAETFNGRISNWDVSLVENFRQSFAHAEAFNQNISDWDVSSSSTFQAAFKGTGTFNGRISNWDVSLVENFNQSFWKATAFNQNISDWDVSSSSNFFYAFAYASSFNQCLEWVLKEGALTVRMFESSSGRLGPCGSS